MNNTTEPRLPDIPLYQETSGEIVLEALLTLLPLTLFIGLPVVYIIVCAVKWIAVGIYKKMTKCCKKSTCSTELKWIDKNKTCCEYTGNCNPGRMEADIA